MYDRATEEECDRAHPHPGSHLRRCPRRVGCRKHPAGHPCNDPAGHRGRCTSGFSPVRWAVTASDSR